MKDAGEEAEAQPAPSFPHKQASMFGVLIAVILCKCPLVLPGPPASSFARLKAVNEANGDQAWTRIQQSSDLAVSVFLFSLWSKRAKGRADAGSRPALGADTMLRFLNSSAWTSRHRLQGRLQALWKPPAGLSGLPMWPFD